MENKDSLGFFSDAEKFLMDENKEISDFVKDILDIKFNDDFETIKIGNRIDSEKTILYLCLKNNTSLVFKAVADFNLKEVTDNYINRRLSFSISNELANLLHKSKTECTSSVTICCDNDSEEIDDKIEIAEYLEKYNAKSFFIYLMIDQYTANESTAENLLSATKELYERYGVSVVVKGTVVGDDYSKAAKNMVNDPLVSSTWFESYNVTGYISFAILDGRANISVDALSKNLLGDEQ